MPWPHRSSSPAPQPPAQQTGEPGAGAGQVPVADPDLERTPAVEDQLRTREAVTQPQHQGLDLLRGQVDQDSLGKEQQRSVGVRVDRLHPVVLEHRAGQYVVPLVTLGEQGSAHTDDLRHVEIGPHDVAVVDPLEIDSVDTKPSDFVCPLGTREVPCRKPYCGVTDANRLGAPERIRTSAPASGGRCSIP